MSAAGNARDGFVDGAADHLRHALLTPVTTISARTQLLARDLRRSPTLAEAERGKMLASITAIEAEVRALCAVIDAMNLPSRDGLAAPTDGES